MKNTFNKLTVTALIAVMAFSMAGCETLSGILGGESGTASQAAQQQTTQATTQPTRFNPAPNQPSPVGAWKGTGEYSPTFTFNANGTGNHRQYSDNRMSWATLDLRWSASGNRLTINYTGGGNPAVFIFEITGDTLKWVDSQRDTDDPDTFTRQ